MYNHYIKSENDPMNCLWDKTWTKLRTDGRTDTRIPISLRYTGGNYKKSATFAIYQFDDVKKENLVYIFFYIAEDIFIYTAGDIIMPSEWS